MPALKDFAPPVVYPAFRLARKWLKNQHGLFDGSGEVFRREAAKASVYFEYGMGASTAWVLSNTSARVFAVDTSEEWVEGVRSRQPEHADRLQANWIDVGPLQDWGQPRDYAKRGNFSRYIEHYWDRNISPDLILIDGRFRIACFLHCLAHAKAGTRIIIDDYSGRPRYRVAEEFAELDESCGRQALFKVPSELDRSTILAEKEKFIYVTD